jgi:LCP family protein required for cell wall assembly
MNDNGCDHSRWISGILGDNWFHQEDYDYGFYRYDYCIIGINVTVKLNLRLLLEYDDDHSRPGVLVTMKKTGILILIQILLLIFLCSLPRENASSKADYSGRSDYLLIAPPGSTPTPTPFQPIPPTPLYISTGITPETTPTEIPPTSIPLTSVLTTSELETSLIADERRTWEDYPGPSVWPDIEVPAPVGILAHPEGQVNILLLGSDQRPDEGGFRTDTIQLLTINPLEGSVKLTSFPRDLYVYIPGYTVERINTAMGWGGFEALAQTMEYNFGVEPEYYVLINFWSFKEVIDSIGGISIDIGRDMCDQRDGFGWYCVSQTTMWMDGESALWYVRARYATSDLDRGRRQQEVLQAIFKQLLSLNGLQRAPELYDIYKQNVTTNLDFDLVSKLLPIAEHLSQTQQVGRYSIGADEIYDWTNTYGAMVLVPVREPVLAAMRQVISEP